MLSISSECCMLSSVHSSSLNSRMNHAHELALTWGCWRIEPITGIVLLAHRNAFGIQIVACLTTIEKWQNSIKAIREQIRSFDINAYADVRMVNCWGKLSKQWQQFCGGSFQAVDINCINANKWGDWANFCTRLENCAFFTNFKIWPY